MKRQLPKGFTLVELLVTIAIIAVLSAIGFMTYSAVLKQGRDSRRQSDLRTIQSALEQYYADQGFYPSYIISNNCTATYNGYFVFNCPLKDATGTKTYLNNIPKDPTTPPNYCFDSDQPHGCGLPGDGSSSRCNSYTLYANLENQPSGYLSCMFKTYNFSVTTP